MIKKCPICTNTKGKRGCLINNHKLICSKCCAQIRNSACETCNYYKESQKFAVEKTKKTAKTFTMRIDEEVDVEINRALEKIDSGNIYSGEKILKSLAKENDDLFSIHFAMGVLHAKNKHYDEAIVSFDKSIDIYPYYIDAWFNKALVAKQKADIVQMVYSLKKVIEIGDPDDEVTLQAIDILDTTEQFCYKESGIYLDAYIESMKLFNYGFDFMKKNKWQEALLEFEKTSSINPNNAPTFGNMAICYMQLNENEKAMDLFNKSIEIDSRYEPALINREILNIQMKKNVSNDGIGIKAVYYGKDYSIEDNKLLIDDYLNDSLISNNTRKKKNWYSKLLNIFHKT